MVYALLATLGLQTDFSNFKFARPRPAGRHSTMVHHHSANTRGLQLCLIYNLLGLIPGKETVR